MKTSSTVQLLAFHGTHETAAANILQERAFRIGSYRNDHWLGQGVYFYREDPRQAWIWAKTKVARNPDLQGERAVVLMTQFGVSEEEFLNLDTRTGLQVFWQFISRLHQILEQEWPMAELTFPDSKRRRCYYCDLLPDSFKVIQRTFLTPSLYDRFEPLRSMDLCLHGVQLCVRDVALLQQKDTDLILWEDQNVIPLPGSTRSSSSKGSRPKRFS